MRSRVALLRPPARPLGWRRWCGGIVIVVALFGWSAAGATAAAAQTGPAWTAPVTPLEVLRGFEAPDGPYGPGHRGVDLAASIGTLVAAPAEGTVSFAGFVGGIAVVVVRHDDLRSTFQPVVASVHLGESVRAGEPIGTVVAGSAHCSPSCVHWGVLRGDTYLDPLALLGVSHPRLLPYWNLPPPRGSTSDRASDSTGAAGRPDRSFAAARGSLEPDGQPGTSPPESGSSDPAYASTRDTSPPTTATHPPAQAATARTGARLPTGIVVPLTLATSGLLAWLLLLLLKRRP